MEKYVTLKRDYIHVKREESGVLTYGGDQGFFERKLPGVRHRKKKYRYGCGVVAFGDLLLYLGEKSSGFELLQRKFDIQRSGVLSQKDYVQYFNAIYRLLGGIAINGITSAQLVLQFNRLALQYHFGMTAIWGLSRRKLFDRMESMIGRDLPVILCIPVLLFPRKKDDGLWLYERNEQVTPSGQEQASYQKRIRVKAHFVVVTGFWKNGEETWYEISSWGKRYYLNRKEYDTLIRTHLLGNYFGNILYIRDNR